jgi:lipid-A-disaccharide synthase
MLVSRPFMVGQPTVLVVAGEASGDVHAARLMAALSARRPELRFVGMGGAHMRAEGLHSEYDVSEISVMGFAEVLPRLRGILRVMDGLTEIARREHPVCAILVDVPDFNLRLARRLRRQGIPVCFYVAPTAWAWRPSRADQLRRDVDLLLCIYPFEEKWFRDRGVEARYVGNPLLDDGHLARAPTRAEARRRLDLPDWSRVVALLPGSRRSELARVLPDMLHAARLLAGRRPDLRFVLPVAPGLDRDAVARTCAEAGVAVQLTDGGAAETLSACDAAAVCSGTATLEAALAGRPFVVVYRGNPLSWYLLFLFIRIEHASIVNLLAGREIVPELLQGRLDPERLARVLGRLLDEPAERDRMLSELSRLRELLGGPGASERAADLVLELLAGARAGVA